MTSKALSAYIAGISVLGPGLADWTSAATVLAGHGGYVSVPAVLPAPTALPAAERRRTGRVVKLAIAVGLAAASRAAIEPKSLLTVFTSSAGDGDNCHEICQTLASPERQLSPTRFHNSVHNAPAGYWSIATGAMTGSTTLCAFDGSFSAGLLEAVVQVLTQPHPVLLVAYDCDYPQPLAQTRPIAAPLGIGLVLTQARSECSIARLTIGLGPGIPDILENPQLELLRTGVPAGRGLPLLSMIARQQSGKLILDYHAGTMLHTEVQIC